MANQLYYDNCVKMHGLNKAKVSETQRKLDRVNSPVKKADLRMELDGWQRWVDIWAQRIKDYERDTKEF